MTVAATICTEKRLPLSGVNFPVSGENVCEADKRGAGSAELSRKLRD